jgi:YbgC/YbaW family acyl-CoA thioester hydrolase
MATPFVTTRRVEFVDTDMAGIAHFSNFFRWMESAEVEFLRARGLTVNFPHEGRRIGFPRVAASCDFLRPVTFGDVVHIAVTVERLGRKSITYAFEFSRDGVVAARGKVTSCCCLEVPGHPLEPIELPDWLREKLEE